MITDQYKGSHVNEQTFSDLIYTHCFLLYEIKTSVADPDPGSGAQSFFNPWIRVPDPRMEKTDPGLTSATLVKTIEDEGVYEHQGKSS